MSKAKYDILILELIPLNREGSGFVREDTVELPEDQRIRIIHPKHRVIMNTSMIQQPSPDDEKVMINVVTRYIYGQQEIIKTKQEEAKMSTSLRDKIVFVHGFLIVPNNGAYVGQYNWAKKHAQNASNPDRPLNAEGNPLLPPVFKEVKPAKKADDKNIIDLKVAQAMGFINSKLVKAKGDGYEYNEVEIDRVIPNFGIAADLDPALKVSALIAFAKAKPDVFMKLVKEVDQAIGIEIKHAIELKVIAIEGDSVVYPETSEVIRKFSNVQNTPEKKLAALGNFYQRPEGKEAYELFKARLDAAKAATV